MRQARKRKPTDSLYFVELVDTVSEQRRVAIGNFWAMGPQEAISEAERVFAGLFRGMETRSWKTRAKMIEPPKKRGPLEERKPVCNDLFPPECSLVASEVIITGSASTIEGGGGDAGS